MGVVRLVFDRSRDNGGALPSRSRIVHHLLFADEASVEKVTRQLQQHRFDVTTRRGDDGGCTVLATHHIAPTSAAMDQVAEFFEDLAREHGGAYDGWVVIADA
jgi:hypothetical protein